MTSISATSTAPAMWLWMWWSLHDSSVLVRQVLAVVIQMHGSGQWWSGPRKLRTVSFLDLFGARSDPSHDLVGYQELFCVQGFAQICEQLVQSHFAGQTLEACIGFWICSSDTFFVFGATCFFFAI